MADRIAENADQIVDDMKRKARRRLVGAVVLALAAAIILPMLLEKEPRPLGDDVSVKIPPVDESKFINKLTGKSGDTKALPKADDRFEAKRAGAKPESQPDSATSASLPITTPTTAAPAASASSAESTAPKKSVTDAEQRALSPAAKTATKSDSGGAVASSSTAKPPASAAPESKVEAKPAIVDAKSADAKAPGTDAPSPTASTSSPPGAQAAIPAAPATPSADSSTAAPAAAAKPEGFVVQLAAFADDKGANSLANKLKKVGYSAFVEPVQTSRGTLWRVRVGGYGTRPEADAARTKLKGEGYNGIVAPAT